MPRFGAHMSIAGGLYNAFDIAAAAGCDCLQVFVKNQRQWNARPLRDDEIAAWRAAAARTRIGPVIAHATYLINLASPDEGTWRKSIDAYLIELQRCELLDIESLVVHPGAHLGSGEIAGCRRVAAALDEVLRRLGPARVRPALEITAGQGTCIGHRFEHLRDIIAACRNQERLSICFDTCHALAAGYRFDTDKSYSETFDAFSRAIGLDRLACFHLNDSARPLGSRVDRHTHIGEGHVGRAAFRRIVTDPRFAHVPMILETPKGEDDRGRDYDRLNLGRLRRMAAGRVTTPSPATSRCGRS
jgi:deoxyribonuclease-4